MKLATVFALGAATVVAARSIPVEERAEKFLIQLSETEQKWVTQQEKWDLRRKGVRFMDKTYSSTTTSKASKVKVQAVYEYPTEAQQTAAVNPLIQELSESNMEERLTTFSDFNNRYYKSNTGKQSSAWLLDLVDQIMTDSGASNASVAAFPHPRWTQDSVIATIPGKSEKTVVLGSHQDSVNWDAANPATARAPGADDNGSGSMTILETMRVFLQDPTVQAGEQENTVEFHWYAAEEEGLLGSQAIFESYESEGREVVGMLAQDMTGYIQGTLDAGDPEIVGIITDFVDPDLTEFLKVMVDAYCTIGYIETECGYACSDHASANDAGYPSSFVFESEFGKDDPYIHTANDTIAAVDFGHMLQHARLSLGFAYELSFATL